MRGDEEKGGREGMKSAKNGEMKEERINLHMLCSTHLLIVLGWGWRQVEHAGRNIHALSSHCCIGVSSNVPQMVVGVVVLSVKEWSTNCKY